jgi:hypothetical protein
MPSMISHTQGEDDTQVSTVPIYCTHKFTDLPRASSISISNSQLEHARLYDRITNHTVPAHTNMHSAKDTRQMNGNRKQLSVRPYASDFDATNIIRRAAF